MILTLKMADVNLQSIVSSLKLHKRLEREKGLKELTNAIESSLFTPLDYNHLETCLLSVLTSPNSAWEELHGSLMAANLLIEKEKSSGELKTNLTNIVNLLLENEESRVRLITGNYTACLSRDYHVIITCFR